MKLLCFAIVAIGSVAAQADLIYTFDTDNQGWRQANFNQTGLTLTDLGPANWNAGGFIDGPDFAAWAFHTSPLLSGGFAGSASISFDYSAATTDGVPYPFLVLASATEAIYRDPIVPGGGAFNTYSYNLTSAAGWKYGNATELRAATMADITNVLGGLQRIGINADLASGSDYTRVDNVRLTAVPEPMSLLALGLGASALIRRRKR